MDINFEYYKIFYYVADEGSMSLAAKKMCVSQPAVSQAVRQLEQIYGCSLFIRESRGVKLTKEGEILFSYVKKGYEFLLMGDEKLRQVLELDRGEIRIGASDMTLKYFLLSYLEKFHKEYPNIKVSVTNAPTPETLAYLQNGMIDFGIISGPVSKEDALDIIPVRKIKDVFIGGEAFKDMKGRVLDYSELTKVPMILLEGNTSTRKHLDTFLAERKIELVPEFEIATSDMIVQFALKNLGIGFVVEDFAKKYLESGELFRLKFAEEIPDRDMCIAINTRLPMSNAAATFVKSIMAE